MPYCVRNRVDGIWWIKNNLPCFLKFKGLLPMSLCLCTNFRCPETKGGNVTLKSASPQAFLLRHNTNLGFHKCNCTLFTLNFRTQLLIATFMARFGMVKLVSLALIAWWWSPTLFNLETQVQILGALEFMWLVTFLFENVALLFFALKKFFF